jgi:hypothetical protein
VWENGGIYMIGLKPLAAHETVHIDVKKLRDEQIPDERGRTIPLTVASGQLQWTLRRKDTLPDNDERANLSLIGRSEQVDLTKKIVNNYACQNCCTGDFAGGHLEAAIVSQTFMDLEVQSSRFYFAVEDQQTCYGYQYGAIISGSVNNAIWNTSDINLATVNPGDGTGGNVTGVNAGRVQITANWHPRTSIVNPCPPGGGGGGPLFTEEAEEKQCDIKADTAEQDSQKKPEDDKKEKKDEPANTPNIAQCGTCVSRSFNYTAQVNFNINPKVTISPIQIIGKDLTKTVSVQVIPSNNSSQITLNLRVLDGTGEARFSDTNTTTKTITSSQNVQIKGITESSAKDNIVLEAKLGNVFLPNPRNFSVAKIKISRTIGTQQPTDITNLMTDTIVGERFKLKAEISPSGLSVLRWSNKSGIKTHSDKMR